MSVTSRRWGLWFLALLAVSFLAACGGGSASSTEESDTQDVDGDNVVCEYNGQCPDGQVCNHDGQCVPDTEEDGDTESGDADSEALSEGESDGPIIEVPATVNFDSVMIGNSSNVTFQISNTGNRMLTLGDIVFGLDTTEFEFTSKPSSGTNVQPGGSVGVTITYTPKTLQAQNFPIFISSNAVNNSNARVLLKSSFKGTSILRLDPTDNPIQFGNIDVGALSNITLSLCNDGNDNKPITVTSIALQNQATMAQFGLYIATPPSETSPLYINPGTCTTVKLTYHPTEPTEYPMLHQNSLLIANDADQLPAGLAPKQTLLPLVGSSEAYALKVTPNPIAFGDTELNTPQELPISISNQTGQTVNITSLALDATTCAGFLLDNSSHPIPFTMAQDAIISDIKVGFNPTAIRLYQSCKLRITASLGSDSIEVLTPVTGAGVAKVYPPTAQISYGSHGAPITDPIYLSNTSLGQMITFWGDGSFAGCNSADCPEDVYPLTYKWEILSKPDDSNMTIAFPTQDHIQIKPTLAGTYIIQLTVTDGRGQVGSATVNIAIDQNERIVVMMEFTGDGAMNVELGWVMPPNDLTCSDETMYSSRSCNTGGNGTAIVSESTAQASQGRREEITHNSAADGIYYITAKFEQDCPNYAYDLNCVLWGRDSSDVTIKIYVNNATTPTYTIPSFNLASMGAQKRFRIVKDSGTWKAPAEVTTR